ncbi:DUF2147 domain-containing protein [Spirosoma aerophilum]
MLVVFSRYRLFIGVLVVFLLTATTPDSPADQIVGRWLFPSQGSSVDVYRKGNRYFARVAEVDQAGEKNYGLVKDTLLIRDLGYNGELWTGGRLIHPKTGISLNVEIEMQESHAITVTIYKGIKLLRKTFVMTRQTGQ